MSYISREEAIKAITDTPARFAFITGQQITALKKLPTADVAPVRHGKSISKMHYSDEFICSECGLIMRECCRYEIDEDADGDESCYGFEFKYCPRCGAKMDGERERK